MRFLNGKMESHKELQIAAERILLFSILVSAMSASPNDRGQKEFSS